MPLNPQAVMQSILQPGYTDVIKLMCEVVGSETWESAHLVDIPHGQRQQLLVPHHVDPDHSHPTIVTALQDFPRGVQVCVFDLRHMDQALRPLKHALDPHECPKVHNVADLAAVHQTPAATRIVLVTNMVVNMDLLPPQSYDENLDMVCHVEVNR